MTSRVDIMTALLDTVSATPGFKTYGDRLKFWTSVPNQPALFTRYIGEDFPPRETRGLPRPPMIMRAELWIYANQTDADAATTDVLLPLIDAVCASLAPAGARNVQTLGVPAIISHAWIEGDLVADDGAATGGQAVAVVPVRILVTGPLT